MKIFLRSTKTGRYFRSPEEWTEDMASAAEFEELEQAIRTACLVQLDQVEAVFRPDNSAQEVRLPFR